MEMRAKVAIAAGCGGAFGLVTGIAIVKISVLSLGGPTPFDQSFSQSWSNMLTLTLVPGACIGCAAFFAFLCLTGFFRVSTFVGIAAGAAFGFFFGPPESMLPGFDVAKAIVLLLWECLFGGVGGFVGSMIGRWVQRFD